MAGFQSLATATLAGLLLSGCVAMAPPIDVVRFHNAPVVPVTPGTVVIEPNLLEDAHNRSIEQASYGAALLRELQRVGFSEAVQNGGESEYVARYTIERAVIDTGGTRSPVSVGVGGSTGSYGSGVGLGIGINLGGRRKDRIVTDLAVRISQRTDNLVVWEGRASVEAKEGSPAAQPGLAAAKLAEALFRDFPGESGTTIRVP